MDFGFLLSFHKPLRESLKVLLLAQQNSQKESFHSALLSTESQRDSMIPTSLLKNRGPEIEWLVPSYRDNLWASPSWNTTPGLLAVMPRSLSVQGNMRGRVRLSQGITLRHFNVIFMDILQFLHFHMNRFSVIYFILFMAFVPAVWTGSSSNSSVEALTSGTIGCDCNWK